MTDLSHFTTGDGCRLAYRFDGAEDAPVLVLSNSIATTPLDTDPPGTTSPVVTASA